jgi:hypothetical protein
MNSTSAPYSFICQSPSTGGLSNWQRYSLWHVLVHQTHSKVNRSCLTCVRQQFTSPDIFPQDNPRRHNALVKHIWNTRDVRCFGILCSWCFPTFRENLSFPPSLLQQSKKNARSRAEPSRAEPSRAEPSQTSKGGDLREAQVDVPLSVSHSCVWPHRWVH